MWQQSNYRGEKDEEADTGEGKCYPGDDQKKKITLAQAGKIFTNISARIVIIPYTSHPGFFTLKANWY